MKAKINLYIVSLFVVVGINLSIKLFAAVSSDNYLIAYFVRVCLFTLLTMVLIKMTKKYKLYAYINEYNLLYLLASFTSLLFVLMHCSFKYMLTDFLFVLYTATLLKESIAYIRNYGVKNSWLVILVNIIVYILYLNNDYGTNPSNILMYLVFTGYSYMNAVGIKLTSSNTIKLLLGSLIITLIITFVLYGRTYITYKVGMLVNPEVGSELFVLKILLGNAQLIGPNTYQNIEIADYILRHLPKYWIVYKYGILPFLAYTTVLIICIVNGIRVMKNQFCLVSTLILYQLFSIIMTSISVIGDDSLLGYGVLISIVILLNLVFVDKDKSNTVIMNNNIV